jgi:hypothetical protein
MTDRLEQQIEPVTLLTCPFCGKLPLRACDTSYGYWSVVCGDGNECAVKPDAQGGSELQAIAAWNTRTTPAPSQHSELADRFQKLLDPSWSNEFIGIGVRAFGDEILRALRQAPDTARNDALEEAAKVAATWGVGHRHIASAIRALKGQQP